MPRVYLNFDSPIFYWIYHPCKDWPSPRLGQYPKFSVGSSESDPGYGPNSDSPLSRPEVKMYWILFKKHAANSCRVSIWDIKFKMSLSLTNRSVSRELWHYNYSWVYWKCEPKLLTFNNINIKHRPKIIPLSQQIHYKSRLQTITVEFYASSHRISWSLKWDSCFHMKANWKV